MATSLPTNGVPPGAPAQAQANNILKQDADKANLAVHTFDPNSSPQDKAKAAGVGRDQLKTKVDSDKDQLAGKEVPIDTGAKGVVPTITIEDVDKKPPSTDGQPAATAGHAQTPGAFPAGRAPPIPDWYKIGWRTFTGIDVEEDEDEKDKRMLHAFISDQFYGDWYHNAAIIIFAVFASHFLTRFSFGWGWLFLVLAVCSTYYATSMARLRRRARDDIQRELVKTRLASEHESADWMNEFLERFWLIYEPVLSATIVASVDQVLSTNCPPFLDSMRLSSFTLGSKAPRIDKVRTFPRTAEDIVMMDWGLSFTPNDLSDLTPRQQATKCNPKIVLSIRVGKGVAVASMPVLVEDMTFSGLLRIRMKLMTNFPHIQVVDISFLEKPVIDYVLKPIGGETFGFDIANIPGLSSFIRDTIHSILGPMMYDPNVFTLNLEQLLSGTPLDSAVGVVQVTIHNARSLKGSKIGGGTPDPYVSLSINNRAELGKTKYKHSTYNPSWNETKFLLVNNITENLVLTLYDFNEHRKDTELGAALFEFSKLEEDATQEDLAMPVLKDGKDRGELRFDVSYYPVLKPEMNEFGVEELPESTVGIVRLVVHQCKDLDSSKVHTTDLNPIAKVHLGDSKTPVHETPKVKHTLQPVWESATEFLCTDRLSSVITVKVIDDRDFLKDPVIGYMRVRLEDLLEARKEVGRDWWPLSGCKTGRIRLSAEWKPLNMAGSVHGAEQYVPPIGVVRLWLKKATDVKNVEAALGGKSDPYVRVIVNNTIQARTEVVNNNLNPEWDQIIYNPVHSLRETMLLEIMDYQHLTKDRTLGTVELKVSDLAVEAKDPKDPRFHYRSTGKKDAADPIRLDRGKTYKGNLHYVAEFVPAIALTGVEFETKPAELEAIVEEVAEEGEGTDVPDDVLSVSSSNIDAQAIPKGITASAPISENADTNANGNANGKVKAHKKSNSADTTRSRTESVRSGETAETNRSNKTGETGHTAETGKTDVSKRNEEKQEEEEGVEMSKEELLQQQSGVIVFHVRSGELTKKARLEVLLDDAYWPAFSTARATGHKAHWAHVGEGFLKELDFGRVWLRLNAADEGDKDDILGEWKGDAKAFLDKTLDAPQTYTLVDQDEVVVGKVEVESRYVPVPVQLEPRESINNQGVLRVVLLDGQEIRAVDRGGKSDPFAVFTLNGQRVYKSQTKKKTLSPDWREDFFVNVPSRVKADFHVEVFDWNQIEQAKALGSAQINLEDLEPFNGVERVLPLYSDKHGQKGSIRVSLLFQPEIIARSRKNTSTFSTAGRAMTQIGALPIGAGKGVFHGVTGIFKRDKDEDFKDGVISQPDMDGRGPVPDIPGSQMSQPVGMSDRMVAGDQLSVAPTTPPPSHGEFENGTLKVTVLDAKDLGETDSVKPYAVVRVGDKEMKTKHAGKTLTPEWNETFTFSANPAISKLYAWIWDHKTLGKDKILGEAEVDIWRHVRPTGQSSADVFVELRDGQGLLRLRLEFDADVVPAGRRSTTSVTERSLGSPSRFSLRARRPGSDKDA
ncbi:hypothetical protein EWM64_g967 [Hericium alpestre]|uniref:Tricalbin n=1 Tax=Hericium alpestre TaxID=135208 RepID=A0A4Z0A7I0_9AGAM|nr:hypothetical protein EWM64_g967 [Hericium alpestre]